MQARRRLMVVLYWLSYRPVISLEVSAVNGYLMTPVTIEGTEDLTCSGTITYPTLEFLDVFS
jgi:hypothetical protein